jgi:flagellar hook-associated protein 2
VGLSSPGIGSNLDINGIVTQLMAIERQPLTALNKKEASYQAKISAFGSLSGALSGFQNALAALSTPAKFQSVSAASGDATVASATATSKAVAGTYDITVTKLAQAQTISTRGQATTTSAIGDGVKTTLAFSFGSITGGKLDAGIYSSDVTATPPNPTFTQDADQSSGSVVIDSSNNSLQGIRDAINKASIGVTATIVSDGSATPSHLVLTSNKTGQTSSMNVAVIREPSADPLDPTQTALADLLTYDPAPTGKQNMTQSSAGQDSALTVNGIAISGPTKSIREAIQGVTLNVSKLGATTVTIARDTAAIQTGVTSFVKAYNDLDKTIKSLTSYDAVSKTGGPLLGDATVRSVQSQMRKALTTAVAGTGGGLTTLSQVGIGFQKNGTLALDATKLQNTITNNFDNLAGLFASTGIASDSLVSFVGASPATKVGSSDINIAALATRGSVAAAAPPNLTITAGSNDQFALAVNGISANITLAPGTYTSASLVAQLQSTINGNTSLSKASLGVNVSADASGKLTITSTSYGSGSTISLTGTGAEQLLGTPIPAGVDGINVAGTINGVAAIGSGQSLTGATGSANEGLRLQIVGGALGSRGTINYSQGYAALLNTMVGNLVGTGGVVAGQTDGLQRSVTDLGKSRDALNDKLAATEARYRKQYSALDVMIGKMNSTSTYLTQQLAAFASSTK